ncbi:DUF2206 domain-containing protein [Halocatena pleomorpha]|uniref:DUF2206 domain-containing protein n=1 Tax=Halocatena pleomorpha TaxID=1785090 RepID=A0A3P3REK2_9EURY|nr:DUF2206 domain-containing protein [Halocatena pleomorpha]RRJ31821.1 DUF2206 domain-containing protein [Halocatena pleomorpha]
MPTFSNRTVFGILSVLISYLLLDAVLGGVLPGSPLLRSLFGFVLLTVAPGYLFVMLLGIRGRPPGRILLYSVGLSLFVVVVLSALLNSLLSLFSFARPLSSVSLTVAVLVLVLSMAAVCYVAGSTLRSPLRSLSLSHCDQIAVVVVSLLPMVSILLTVFSTIPRFDQLQLVLLCLLSTVPLVLQQWDRSPALSPYAIWAVSAAVLFQMTLVSGHLWGFDIHFEYATAANILHDGYWDPGASNPSNSLATVTLLAAVYSMVTGLDLVWVYKFVYPVLVSLLPLGVWYVVRSTFEDRSIATLAPFALVFYYGFFKDMPDKQLVAGLFAVFLLIVFLDTELSPTQRWTVGLAFAVALTLSHYGVSLLFTAFLGSALLARYAVQMLPTADVDARLTRPALVGFLGVFWVVWYLFTASGVNFYRVVGVGYELLSTLPFPMAERSGAAYATAGFTSVYWIIYKFLHIVLAGLIGIGMFDALSAVVTDRDGPSSVEYSLFSAGVLAFLGASVVFTFGMGFDRTFQIALFVVAPFAITGARTVISVVSRGAVHLPLTGLRAHIAAVPVDSLFAVFLAVLFLFSSGTVFAVAGEQLPPYNINVDEDAGWPVYSQSEVDATRWLATHTDTNDTIAVYNEWDQIKSRDGLLVSEVVPADKLEPIWLNRTTLNRSGYVYVSHKPMLQLGSDTEYIDARNTPFYRDTLSTAETVYTDRNVTIYYVEA